MIALFHRQRYVLLFLMAALCYSCAHENKYLHDKAGILSIEEKRKLTSEIAELEASVGSQIAILIIDSLKGEKLEEFSLRTANEMKIGRKEYDDGVLITVVLKERKMRIEVGYGLESILDNETASRIINEQMAPKFRQQKYFDGLMSSVVKIKALIESKKDLIVKQPT